MSLWNLILLRRMTRGPWGCRWAWFVYYSVRWIEKVSSIC